MMSRASISSAAWLLLGACGSSHPGADAGADAEADAAVDAEVPTGCEDFVPDGNRACVPSGRLWFGRISDDESDPPMPPECNSMEFLYLVNSCAHELTLPPFAIDLREVSVAAYGEAVADGVVPPPPELCDTAGFVIDDSDCDLEVFCKTGFDSLGQPIGDWLERPVSCVYKDEARAYCEWRGGRLPLSTEWMKAARGGWPSRREIPWADDVLLPFTDWGRLPPFDLVNDGENGGGPTCESLIGAPREPVTSRPENASPYGLLHVLGNVREWVEVAPSGDLYEETQVDVFGFGEVRASHLHGVDTRISVGVPAEHPIGESYLVRRDHTLGFRCAYDL